MCFSAIAQCAIVLGDVVIRQKAMKTARRSAKKSVPLLKAEN
jgi:hypothetical protein